MHYHLQLQLAALPSGFATFASISFCPFTFSRNPMLHGQCVQALIGRRRLVPQCWSSEGCLWNLHKPGSSLCTFCTSSLSTHRCHANTAEPFPLPIDRSFVQNCCVPLFARHETFFLRHVTITFHPSEETPTTECWRNLDREKKHQTQTETSPTKTSHTAQANVGTICSRWKMDRVTTATGTWRRLFGETSLFPDTNVGGAAWHPPPFGGVVFFLSPALLGTLWVVLLSPPPPCGWCCLPLLLWVVPFSHFV